MLGRPGASHFKSRWQWQSAEQPDEQQCWEWGQLEPDFKHTDGRTKENDGLVPETSVHGADRSGIVDDDESAGSHDPIDDYEAMLLSSTLHKLRIVNLPRHDPTSSSSPTTALDSVRITSIAFQTAPGGRDHSPQMRKLRSAPARRGYSDLESVAGGPSQYGDVAIDPVPTSFDLVPMHRIGVHAVEDQPIPNDRPLGRETESNASTTAAASLSSPPRSPLLKSVHAPAMALTISTGVDMSGHRVLTSRRRQSAPPSPTKCRKIKTAFGVGDEDDSASLHASSDTLSLTTLPPLSAQSDPHPAFFATTSPALGDSLPDQSNSPSSPPHHFDPVFETETSHSLRLDKHPREHLPIKTFTPPPPLVATSPPRLSTLSVLTRSSTLSSSSTTTSSTTLSRSNSRLQSFARRRSTLKRFSLPNNTLSLPPLSPTITSEGAPLERRFSSHVDTTTTGLERHASCGGSSSGTCPSSPGFPPTPTEGSPLLPSPTSYFPSSADPGSLINSPELDLGSPPYNKPIRVSFDLPSARLLRNAPFDATGAAHHEKASERSPPRPKPHVRSLSEGATTEQATWTASPSSAWFVEEELHLTVTNPDLSASRPASSASSHPLYSLPLESSSALERRNFTSTPPTPHLQAASPSPPPLFIPSHEIGIAC
ncbi:hypothetical protein RHOSPDRAFT_33316 [Rhodotorula sp. JG-1b]|nr:hypothetical protein RHOSPDRAFT_33316 [Rhodotorula sp. JG-1b]